MIRTDSTKTNDRPVQSGFCGRGGKSDPLVKAICLHVRRSIARIKHVKVHADSYTKELEFSVTPESNFDCHGVRVYCRRILRLQIRRDSEEPTGERACAECLMSGDVQ